MPVIVAALAALLFGATAALAGAPDDPTVPPPGYTAPANDGLGVKAGQIKHVWLIVLENKAYDASFTGLNNNTYLWQTLPSQGALLTNYYGTGHSSLDNYTSMVSGQAPITDNQSDCPAYTALSGNIDTTGSLATNSTYGQFKSAAGPEAPAGDNGCVYPAAGSNQTPLNSVETLFNQLDANNVSWKEYAQDLGNTDSSGSAHDAGTQYCGAPAVLGGVTQGPGPTPTSTQASSPGTDYPNPSSANSTDQYVAKHNPLPWFQSILGSSDCNSAHLAPLFGSNDQLLSDLQSDSTTPAFSMIVPNNCSNGHDAVCAGNNLSGGFGTGANSQVPNSPTNYSGGLYSTDLFLQHIIPEIEASPAFSDGGLIDVTFDEAYPPFTWQNSFVNSSLLPSTAFGSLTTDEAGETLYGKSLNWEPTGPNTPTSVSPTGQQMNPGPGYNENIDRPSSATTGALVACSNGSTGANGWVTAPTSGCLLGGGSTTPGARNDTISVTAGSSTVSDNSVSIKDEGRSVTIPSGTDSGDASQETTDGGYFVGPVTETSTAGSTPSGGHADTGTFELVNSSGAAVTDLPDTITSGSVTIGAQTAATDPLYDPYDPTTGGGDSGSVLISPLITPGTVSNVYYNHYSLLRTLEDIFNVTKAGNTAGTTTGGLDGDGHLGYAAQPGLAPFGSDVFTDATTPQTNTVTSTVTTTTTTPGSTVTSPATTVTGPGGTTTVTRTVTNSRTVIECVVPDVKRDSLSEAEAMIRAAQCKVGRVRGPRSGVVSSQSPGPGSQKPRDTSVSIVLKRK